MNIIKRFIFFSFRFNQADIKTKGKIIGWLFLFLIVTSCGDGSDEHSGRIIKNTSVEYSLFEAPVLKAKTPTVVELDWDEIEGAKKYEILRSTDENSSNAIPIATTEDTSFTDTNLEPKTKYYYWIKICFDEDGCENSVKTEDYGAIETPGLDSISLTDLTLTVINETEIKISWESVDGAKLYKVYRSEKNNINSANTFKVFSQTDTDSNKGDYIGTTNSTSYSDKNIKPGATYYYWYKACSLESECSNFSNSVIATTPNTSAPGLPEIPNALTLTVMNFVDIQSNWVSVDGASSYQLYRSQTNDNAGAALVATTSSLIFMDNNLATTTTYYYWLKACNSNNECSGFSNVASDTTQDFPPNTPSAPVLTVNSSTEIDASWSSVADANYYQLYRSTSALSGTSQIVSELINTAFNDTGLTSNTTYYYWLKACKTGGNCSNFSNSAVATTALEIPDAPSAPALTVMNYIDIQSSWDSVDNSSSYQLYRSQSNDNAGATLVTTTATVLFMDNNLAPTTTYYYWLKACNSNNECSGFSNVASGTTQDLPPNTPSAPVLTVNSSTEIDASWSSVADANYYQLYRSTSDLSSTSQKINESSNTVFNDTGLTGNTTYYYWLKACKTGGNCSNFSNSAVATTQDSLPNTPSAPVLTLKANTKIDVSWSIVSDSNYYQLYRSTSALSSTSQKISELINTEYNDTGLTGNTTYYYWLKACKTGGNCSPYSTSSSATTYKLIGINDTGITIGANSGTSGNNPTCTSDIPAPQDCNQGRDAKALANQLVKVGGGIAGFDFTKLAADGSELSIQNATWDDNGSEVAGTRWSCVRDNYTGFTWEVKNNDGNVPTGSDPKVSADNIHHKDNEYRWGGLTATGLGHPSSPLDYYNDWDTLVNGANQNNYGGKIGLCGYKDWRAPAIYELSTITFKGAFVETTMAIDLTYFPNTITDYYWSSTPNVSPWDNDAAWVINTQDGRDDGFQNTDDNYRLRLVRGGM